MSKSRKHKPARSPRGGRARRRAPGTRRWVAIPLALGIAAAALYVALRGSPLGEGAAGPPPLDHIDADSRVRLERVLRDADLAEER